jgi:hypothetical protein
MARADYDYNIWSDEPSTLTLTAYQQYVDTRDDEYNRTDTYNYIHVTFRFPEDVEEIEYLLKDLYINQYPLTDYDDWVDNPFTLGEDAPPKVAQFLESLPDYEMERV